MKKVVRSTFCTVAAAAVIWMFAWHHGESEATRPGSDDAKDDIRAALEAGDSLPRQEPFEVRPFIPYPGARWVGNAVAYGCYRAGQAPGQQGPSDDQILEDLQIIAEHWRLIRVYGADDDTRRILDLIETNHLPIKVMLGIWLQAEEGDPAHRAANIEQTMAGIELANRYADIVVAVSAGNETQVSWSAHRMDPRHLIRYIRAVRSSVAAPVTTADDYNFWNKPESKAVAGEIDFVVTHMHPLWNGKTLANAIGWLDETFDTVAALHPDRSIVLGETGWATAYDSTKTGPGQQGTLVKGEVGLVGQADFLGLLDKWSESKKATTFWFEAFDEPWKGGGASSPADEIEKHWGVYYEDRTPKASFIEYLKQRGRDTR